MHNKMRYFIILLYLIVFTNINIIATDINGQFVVVEQTTTELAIKLQISTNTGVDDMGGVTIPVSFDTNAIDIPFSGINYTFHNFSGGTYSTGTITRPIRNQFWVNINLLYVNSNNGTIVAQYPNWTDVVTIRFNIKNQQAIATASWQINSIFWGVYDADNITQWQIGTFNNLEYALPIELTAFTANIKNGNVELEWATENEINNYGFEIQRKINDGDWNKIGFVAGSGNSNSLKYYSFIDNRVAGGNNFKYRLKQMDNDGTYKIYNYIELNVAPKNFNVYQNYPNPFNLTTIIKYELPIKCRVQIKIYDWLGKEIRTLVDEEKDFGVYDIAFNALGLASGVYFYSIYFVDNVIITKKMIYLK